MIWANLTYASTEIFEAELSEAGTPLLISNISYAMLFAINGVTYPKQV